MRSMWKGTLAFGLVAIPVKMYTATEDRDIKFRQIHRKDNARVQFRRFCSGCGEEVPYEDIIKGYELPDGTCLPVTEDDLAGLAGDAPAAKMIDVLSFCPAADVPPMMSEKFYFLEPEQPGQRPYALVAEALARKKKAMVCMITIRGSRPHLATVTTGSDRVLVLTTMRSPDEVREAAFPFLEARQPVRRQEVTMAEQLMESMAEPWDPAQHTDRYREAMAALLDEKAGQAAPVQVPQRADDKPQGQSMIEALQASIDAAQAARVPEPAAKPRRSKPAAAARGQADEPKRPRRARKAG